MAGGGRADLGDAAETGQNGFTVMDAYQRFCADNARRFAETEELEAEQRALRPTPQPPSTSRSDTSALTDAQIARLCDNKIEAALHEFIHEFAPFYHTALDGLSAATGREFDKDAAEFERKLAEQRQEYERKLVAQRKEFEDQLAALRVSDAITRSLIGGRANVLPFDNTVIRKILPSDIEADKDVA